MKQQVLSLLAATSCLLAGCGTLERGKVRQGYPLMPKSSVYPATAFDAAFLPQIGIPGIFAALIDLPISLTTDTLLLPYDLATRSRRQQRANERRNPKPQ